MGLWGVFWASFLGLLLGFVHSTQQFFARVHGGELERSKGLRRPLLTQAGVLALASMGVAATFFVEEFWPGILLVPAVVTLWLAEGWSYYRARTVT